MKIARRALSRCTSIQKVTAALLLSFLTFGAVADGVERDESQYGLQAPELGSAKVQSSIEPDVHRFVCPSALQNFRVSNHFTRL